MPDLVTIKGIEIVKTGVEYPASTGPFTCTREIIDEIIASQEDPHILAPRIKLGHLDNPLDDELQELFESRRHDDSNPSIGTWQNLRVDDKGHTLLGDMVGIPQWLADIMTSAYPARSIEGGAWWNDANHKGYKYTLQAVALLGVAWPGCTSLADLQELFSEGGPEITLIEMSKGGNMPVVAQANVGDIVNTFYREVAQGDKFWWWIHEIMVDPNELIVEDEDEGQFFRVPFTVGDSEVEFADEIPVQVKYIDQPKEDGDKASVRMGLAHLPQGSVIAAYQTAAASRPADRNRPKEVTSMTAEEVRKSLDLAEDASDEDVINKISELKGEREPDEPDTPDQTGNEGDVQTPSGEPPSEDVGGEKEPESTGVAANGVTVDKDALAQLQRDASAGVEARKVQLSADRSTFVEAAVTAGKFPPASVKSYREQLDKGGQIEAATREFIESLPANTIPVEARGEGGGGEGASLSSSEYPTEWLSPVERAVVQSAASGVAPTPTITKEAQ